LVGSEGVGESAESQVPSRQRMMRFGILQVLAKTSRLLKGLEKKRKWSNRKGAKRGREYEVNGQRQNVQHDE
jgi:hypothetical protein